jgi:hypothetical protein
MTVAVPGRSMRRLAVFMQFLAGLDRVQALGHQRTPGWRGRTTVQSFPG